MAHSIPDGALVVIADGGKALLLRRVGPGPGMKLREERRLHPQTLSEVGPSGSRPDDQYPKQTDEASFANLLAHTLQTMHQHREFEALVLVADPQTLGQLRGALHKTTEAAVIHSLAKDLTNHPLPEIEKALES